MKMGFTFFFITFINQTPLEKSFTTTSASDEHGGRILTFFNLKKITGGPCYICNNIPKPNWNYSPPTLCYTHSKISTKECRILCKIGHKNDD